MKVAGISGLMLLFCLTPVVAQVIHDYDREYDFKAVKTYAWKQVEPMTIIRADPDNKQVPDETIDKVVRTNVEKQLKKKGLKMVPMDQADVLVAYFVIGSYDLGIEEYDPGAAGNPDLTYGHWRPFYQAGQDRRLLAKGEFTVDLIDRGSNQLIWRGSSSKTIKAVQDVSRDVNKAITKIFKKFPPKPGK